jgi:hypothetical protein
MGSCRDAVVNLADVITFAEATFNTKMGYPGKYADGHPGIQNISGKVDLPRVGSRPYVTLLYTQRAPSYEFGAYGDYAAMWEHKLACEFINALDTIRGVIGRGNPKPDLYWRNIEKVSYYKDIDTQRMMMRARLHIDGCRWYGPGKVDVEPRGYVKLVVDNQAPNVPLLSLNPGA